MTYLMFLLSFFSSASHHITRAVVTFSRSAHADAAGAHHMCACRIACLLDGQDRNRIGKQQRHYQQNTAVYDPRAG